jgi:pilus assembly protein Flp/PilA
MLKLYVAAKEKLASVKNFFSKKEEGAALVEYGLLVGLIACACIAVVGVLGTTISNFFDSINQKLGTVSVP